MKIDDSPALVEALCTVAEKQAFLFPIPIKLQAATPPQGVELLMGSISFSGEASGSISMAMPKPLCLKIVSNILGVDEDGSLIGKEQIDDVLGELLNVLCGQFLTLVEGDKPVFNLSVPSVRAASVEEWERMRSRPGCHAASIDDDNVLLSLVPRC